MATNLHECLGWMDGWAANFTADSLMRPLDRFRRASGLNMPMKINDSRDHELKLRRFREGGRIWSLDGEFWPLGTSLCAGVSKIHETAEPLTIILASMAIFFGILGMGGWEMVLILALVLLLFG